MIFITLSKKIAILYKCCSSNSCVCFVKVFISGLSPYTFMSNKLCRSADEAKRIAADYILAQLGGIPGKYFNLEGLQVNIGGISGN